MLNWQCHRFDEFNIQGLYDVMALRQAVFVVEQDCPYLDLDGQDQQAWHLLAYDTQNLVAYARLFEPDNQRTCRIGRVIIAEQQRGQGTGLQLMQQAIEFCQQHWPLHGIHISAQQHLQPFYKQLGFTATGDAYLEDNIPHIGMNLPALTIR